MKNKCKKAIKLKRVPAQITTKKGTSPAKLPAFLKKLITHICKMMMENRVAYMFIVFKERLCNSRNVA